MKRSRSVMKHQFSTVPKANIPRSSFDRSHGLKTTFDASVLVPVFVDEVLPGDTFNLRMHAFCRLATPIKPILDNLFLDVHFWFVPYRQIWDNFRKFMGEQENPGDSIAFTVPRADLGSGAKANHTLEDYFGLPTNVANLNGISALPFRAYYHIYDQWYRDQNLIDSLTFPTDDGPDPALTYELQKRGKRHDYFTSGLPWPQKGQAVTVPLGTLAPIQGIGVDPAGSANWNTGTQNVDETLNSGTTYSEWMVPGANPGVVFEGDGTQKPAFYADLSSATQVTINALREGFQIQKLLERDARGGTRYSEIVNSHFGVEFLDVTYRPEYLGGGSTTINVAPISQTTPGDPQAAIPTPQGNLAAMGTASLSGPGFTKSFTEHGVVMGIASVRADLTYQQGIERFWNRQTRYDFFWPALSHLGEQEIKNREIYFDNADGLNDNTFAYQERYAEYRYKPSKITGKFRSTDPVSLDYWHLSQEFSTRPVLDKTFIEENVPLDRCIAVPDEPHLLMDAYFQLRCARPMPMYAVPGLIDHF